MERCRHLAIAVIGSVGSIFLLGLVLVIGCVPVAEPNAITVSGRQILLNGAPYTIKGICYHPVPRGSSTRSFDHLDKDLDLMVEAGINTIRVYEPITDSDVLDAIAAKGLKVIIGFGYDQGGRFDVRSGTYVDYVKAYKDHPSILMWELGNEYNYHPKWFGDDIRNWYTAMNRAAAVLKQEDANHPVTTAHGELPDSLALAMNPNIDVWGMNVYRWDDPSAIFREWQQKSNAPMYLSEAGADSFMAIEKNGYAQGLNQKAQADANAKILQSVFNHRDICSGVAVFQFTDGWWKSGNNGQQDQGGWAPNSSGVPYDGAPNEEHWGIVDLERNKKATFSVVKKAYQGP
ncbi:glycoside hydrolase family 2 TIM barrel-domain containing protein [Maribacter sp. 2307ULW6-5]|uniref:glycoside hydrolase family 2 TIM barrel-domain containing protein n=1 Tax=Maribacter sp. 2307ULW6-5 TaxID=3386275 RepID=UPI0039BC2561